MHMNEGIEWTAHCAVLLAALPRGSVLPAARLAEFHGVPAPYLAKSLQALTRAGIVEATSGRFGGYRLARPASAITLLDIVQAMEGKEPLFQCTEIRRRGPSRVAGRDYPKVCGIATAMWRAERAWEDVLKDTTIADLAQQTMEQAPAAAIDKTISWITQVLTTRQAPTT
jgi:Rrf2 family protein